RRRIGFRRSSARTRPITGVFDRPQTCLASDGFLLIRPRSVDHLFECDIFLALGAANQTYLFKVVLGLEQVALFGMPHAVIGPGQSVVRIGGECLIVPIFGIVIAAKLAARIAEQRRHVRIVVIAHGAQGSDAAFKVALVVDERIGSVITVQKILGRTALVLFFGLVLGGGRAGWLTALRRR